MKTNVIYKCMCCCTLLWNHSIEDLMGMLHNYTFNWSKRYQVQLKKIITVCLLWFWNLLADMSRV